MREALASMFVAKRLSMNLLLPAVEGRVQRCTPAFAMFLPITAGLKT